MSSPAPSKTTCYQCELDCMFDVHYESNGRVKKLSGPECPRGNVQLEMQEHPQRLRYPLQRVKTANGIRHQRISWDKALAITADAMNTLKQKHGAESVAFFSGYTKEARLYLQRLAHLFGSPNYMTESGCCFTSAQVCEELTYGYHFKHASLLAAPETRCRLIWSTNPVHSVVPFDKHPIIEPKEGVKMIVVDPRRTETAERADLYLPIRPGSDGALALGIHHLLFKNGWIDQNFLDRWCHGVEEFRNYVKEFSPERVADICQVPVTDIRQAAEWYGTQGPSQLVMSACSTTHHTNGFQNHRAMILLAATTGNVDIPGGNRFFFRNAVPKSIDLFKETIDQLPPRIGSDKFPVWINHIQEAQPMLLKRSIDGQESTQIRGMFALGMNPIMWPNTSDFVESLKKLEFFACVDFFPNPATELADIVFPAATSLEREALISATRCQFRGIVQYRKPIIKTPVGEARSDAQIILDLGCHLGMSEQFWHGDLQASIHEQAETLTPELWEEVQNKPEGVNIFGAVTMDDGLEGQTDRVYEIKGFPTFSGKVEFDSEELRQAGYDGLPIYREPTESPLSTPEMAKKFPLVLTTGGRSIAYVHSQQRQFKQLRHLDPHPRIQMHPNDADSRGIKEGQSVIISSPRGTVEMLAEVTDSILAGVVHAYHGWATANINQLTDDQNLDPISGFPAFKSSLCQVEAKGKIDADNVYEGQQMLNDYLLLHYGMAEDTLPYPFGPRDAIDFPARCAKLVLDSATQLGIKTERAIDVGCSVGRAVFELARTYQEVVGVDLSESFIEAANTLKSEGQLDYFRKDEGNLGQTLSATINSAIERNRTAFRQADACALPPDLVGFDAVLLANLLDRLPSPKACLGRMGGHKGLVRPGGLLVVMSPYTWMEQFTPIDAWLGGYEREGNVLSSKDGIRAALGEAFELVSEEDMPLLIREHARKYQYIVTHVTVWRRQET